MKNISKIIAGGELETVEFIKKNLHVRFEITGAPKRKEVWDYPLPALREAVVNPIVHRDYGDTAVASSEFLEPARTWACLSRFLKISPVGSGLGSQ